MEKRKPKSGKSTPLPLDFAKLVVEILSANFDGGLKALTKLKGKPTIFHVTGSIHPDEVMLAVSVQHQGGLAATTVHASADFDPRASAPTVQDVLGLCVDAAGSVFAQLLDPKHPERLDEVASETLAAMKDVPFDWTSVDVDGKKVWLKIDKSNPALDNMADDWLAKHDPERDERERLEHEATEKLFVTGPGAPKKGPVH